MSDLYQVYRKDKKKRERAIRNLTIDNPGGSTSITYRDPLTGQVVTSNVNNLSSAENRIGVRNTNAMADAKEYLINRINQQQEQLELDYVDINWIRENQLPNAQQNSFGQYGIWNPDSQSYNYVSEDAWLANAQQGNQRRINEGYFRGQALNEFIGGNAHSHEFLRRGGNSAQAFMNNIYDAFAQVASATYGNLYGAAFDSVGQSLLAAELTGRAAQDAQKTIETQVFETEKRQQALRESIGKADEVFRKTKRKFANKNNKKAKARFGGFRKDTPL